jgi:sec-independent protein translocase protein TatA
MLLTVLLMFEKIGMTEILLILIVVLLFFGGKKIPELMRGLGQGIKEFKDASKGEGETNKEKKDNSASPEKEETSGQLK